MESTESALSLTRCSICDRRDSPNHEEAASFLSVNHEQPQAEVKKATGNDDASAVSAALRQSYSTHLAMELRSRFHLRAQKPSRCPMIVIRCGAAGSCAVLDPIDAASQLEDDKGSVIQADVPAYHSAQEAEAVVDVTGGGNTFLGGLVAFLATRPRPSSTGSLHPADDSAWLQEALQWGSISACEL